MAAIATIQIHAKPADRTVLKGTLLPGKRGW